MTRSKTIRCIAILALLLFTFLPVVTYASSVVINEFFANGKGKRPDWIELYNGGNSTVSLEGYSLTDNADTPRKWILPRGSAIRPHEFLLFFADKKNFENHTNFKLDSGGEYLGLYDRTGKHVDSVTFDKQPRGRSQGRTPDGALQWALISEPSLGAANPENSDIAVTNIVSPMLTVTPAVDPQGGFYSKPQLVTITTNTLDSRLHYTLDGSDPTVHSPRYLTPLSITRTTVLRCRAFTKNGQPGKSITHTYFLNESSTLPVISLVTDPENLWNAETGIYVKGNQWKQENYDKNRYNWHHSWKRPANFEFFDERHKNQINMPCRIKIFGAASRNFKQKSFSVTTEKKDDVFFEYPFFPQKNISQFKSFLIRNAGDDWLLTMFRDILMHSIVHQRMDIDIQAWQPTSLFINGRYWGIHNLREKMDPYYPYGNHKIVHTDIDMIKKYVDTKAGSLESYTSLIEYIKQHDLKDTSSYHFISQHIDIDEYINYQLAQIFYANHDWPHNNIAWWKERSDTGKWRWILYDTDEGFKFRNKSSCAQNTLQWATRNNEPSTFLFNALLRNKEFTNRFLQIFAAHLNTTFQPERVIKHIDALQEKIRPEMPRHISRWGAIGSMSEWEKNVEDLRRFARQRPAHIYDHLLKKLNPAGTVTLELNTNTPERGRIQVENVPISEHSGSGRYFKGIPMTLHAIPAPGHTFLRWEGMAEGSISSVMLTPHKSGAVRAVFN